MGRKKIRNPYDKRNHLVTFRLKYFEYQKLWAFSRKIDMTISDVCRMFVSHGIDRINTELAKQEAEDTSDQWDY